jgi:hypothetical protein
MRRTTSSSWRCCGGGCGAGAEARTGRQVGAIRYNSSFHLLVGRSFNGRTRGSGPRYRGSNPCLPAIKASSRQRFTTPRDSSEFDVFSTTLSGRHCVARSWFGIRGLNDSSATRPDHAETRMRRLGGRLHALGRPASTRHRPSIAQHISALRIIGCRSTARISVSRFVTPMAGRRSPARSPSDPCPEI